VLLFTYYGDSGCIGEHDWTQQGGVRGMGLRTPGDHVMDAALLALIGGNLALLGVLLYLLRRLKRLREMKDRLSDRDS
jgi:hypothetical protein